MASSQEVYIRNMEIMKDILKFSEITSIMILMLNNKKYNNDVLLKVKEFEYYEFVEDFTENMNMTENLVISTIPQLLIKNVVTINILLRKNFSEVLINEISSTKLISFFTIIYSSNVELIKNPHLRAEVFDILTHFFIVYSGERNSKQCNNINHYN